MTTVVLTSPPIPGGGTVDGSGRDTVEVTLDLQEAL